MNKIGDKTQPCGAAVFEITTFDFVSKHLTYCGLPVKNSLIHTTMFEFTFMFIIFCIVCVAGSY